MRAVFLADGFLVENETCDAGSNAEWQAADSDCRRLPRACHEWNGPFSNDGGWGSEASPHRECISAATCMYQSAMRERRQARIRSVVNQRGHGSPVGGDASCGRRGLTDESKRLLFWRASLDGVQALLVILVTVGLLVLSAAGQFGDGPNRAHVPGGRGSLGSIPNRPAY